VGAAKRKVSEAREPTRDGLLVLATQCATRNLSVAKQPLREGIVVMGHGERLLVAAPHADVYLNVQFKLNIGWFNQLEPQFPAQRTQRDAAVAERGCA